MLPVSTPPFSFGAPFVQGVHRNERKGAVTPLWFADMTATAELAQRYFGAELTRAGFHLPGYVRVPGVDGLSLRSVWWPDRCRLSADELADLAARVADLPRREEEARARRAAEVAASDAAYAQRGRDGLPRLARIVEADPWQLGRLLGEASEILKSDLTDSSAFRVFELLQAADRTAENAEARLRRAPPARLAGPRGGRGGPRGGAARMPTVERARRRPGIDDERARLGRGRHRGRARPRRPREPYAVRSSPCSRAPSSPPPPAAGADAGAPFRAGGRPAAGPALRLSKRGA